MIDPQPAAIDVVILDMDGVFRHWDTDAFAALAAAHGLSPGELASIVFDADLYPGAMVGDPDAAGWASRIGQRAAAAHGADAVTLAAGFADLPWTLDPAVVDLAAELRAARRARVVLFSNASTKLEDDLRACGLGDAFDRVFNSSRIGQAKPDPAAFRAVVSALGAVPERCLFVDDTAENVDGARQAGLQARPFTSAGDLREDLCAFGLLG